MITKIHTAVTNGLDTRLIEVEVGLSNGLPNVTVVGLPDKAVQESKERIRSAIKQSSYEFPMGRVTVNLAPADVIKSGSSFDLPIAVGILVANGTVTGELKKALFLGELSLDGNIKKVNGVLNVCIWAKNNGFDEIYISKENSAEGAIIKDLTVYAADNMQQLVNHLNSKELMTPLEPLDLKSESIIPPNADGLYNNDFAYVKGQPMAKRALEISAAGGHNVMFIGQPGSGKTLLARSYPTILPTMTEEEMIESTRIYSSCGLLPDGEIISSRPFRAPHHSASHVSLVGGGTKLKPGEISLAHRGVLFLDEFPEFKRETIEVLRQPLEDGFVTITRASGSVTYPSRFYLLAAANPTPSGFDADDPDGMNTPQNRAAIARYQAKFSGPILDRIDIQVEVNRPKKDELQSKVLAEKSSDIAARVQAARDIQTKRFAGEDIFTNAEMGLRLIKKYCKLTPEGDRLMNTAIDKYKLSGRAYTKILKLSRTIADLNGSTDIRPPDIAESLQYRGRWGS